jgi:hypothetical protein
MAGFLLGFAALLLVFLSTSDIAAHYEICETTKEGAKECAPYGVIHFAFHEIGVALNDYNGLITAIATIFIAWFTFSLRQSTDNLWDAGERQLALLAKTSVAQSRDMQASIRAAQQSADIAMQALGTERAWLIFDHLNVATIHGGALDGVPFARGLGFSATWINRGRSPAIGINSRVNHRVVPVNESEATPEFIVDWGGPIANNPLGPGATTGSASQTIVDADVDAFFERQVAVFFYAMAKYEDVFTRGVEHMTEVCIRVRFRGHMVNPQNGQPEPTYFIEPKGPQNNAT